MSTRDRGREQVMEGARPDYECAAAYYELAKTADVEQRRPWFGMAEVEYLTWAGAEKRRTTCAVQVSPLRCSRVSNCPAQRTIGVLCATRGDDDSVAQRPGSDARSGHAPEISREHRRSHAKASLLYPTNASLPCPPGGGECGNRDDQRCHQGRSSRASDLDAKTPHLDKKLNPKVRIWLNEKLPIWEAPIRKLRKSPNPGRKPLRSEVGTRS